MRSGSQVVSARTLRALYRFGSIESSAALRAFPNMRPLESRKTFSHKHHSKFVWVSCNLFGTRGTQTLRIALLAPDPGALMKMQNVELAEIQNLHPLPFGIGRQESVSREAPAAQETAWARCLMRSQSGSKYTADPVRFTRNRPSPVRTNKRNCKVNFVLSVLAWNF